MIENFLKLFNKVLNIIFVILINIVNFSYYFVYSLFNLD